MKKFVAFLIACFSFPILATGAIRLDDEGTSQGFINAIDFTGSGVTATRSGIEGTITVSGGVGGTGVANQVAIWTAATTLGGDTRLLYQDDVATDVLFAGQDLVIDSSPGLGIFDNSAADGNISIGFNDFQGNTDNNILGGGSTIIGADRSILCCNANNVLDANKSDSMVFGNNNTVQGVGIGAGYILGNSNTIDLAGAGRAWVIGSGITTTTVDDIIIGKVSGGGANILTINQNSPGSITWGAIQQNVSSSPYTSAIPMQFEGATDNGFETFFAITDPSADNTITFPNASGTIQLAPTNWNEIGDATAAGTIGFAAFEQDITGSIDTASQSMLTLTNNSATAANSNTVLTLAHDLGVDPQIQYLNAIGDANGTPTTDFLLRQTTVAGGLLMQLGDTGMQITTDGDGALEFLGLGNGSDECLNLNLDDTSNAAVLNNCASSTGLTAIISPIPALVLGTTAVFGLAATLEVESATTTWAEFNSTGSVGTPTFFMGPGSALVEINTGTDDDLRLVADSAVGLYIDEAGGVGIGGAFGGVPARMLVFDVPAAQTIAAGNVITADACGTMKPITSAGAVTTDTTNTFTAAAATNEGCQMDVCNTGANNITLDNNANFNSAGGADVVLTANDCVRVGLPGSSGAWFQLAPVSVN